MEYDAVQGAMYYAEHCYYYYYYYVHVLVCHDIMIVEGLACFLDWSVNHASLRSTPYMHIVLVLHLVGVDVFYRCNGA